MERRFDNWELSKSWKDSCEEEFIEEFEIIEDLQLWEIERIQNSN